MHSLYDEFIQVVEIEDREASLKWALSKLESKELDIVTLYTEILTPALNNLVSVEDDLAFIWHEHVRSSIVRSIIENCYTYVIKERDEKYKHKLNKKVAVVCPSEELHELGARMVTDFFELLGYDALFVGSNTPKEEFYQALSKIELDYIAISVTNKFNLVAARKAIDKIREANSKVKILVGGKAFLHRQDAYKVIGADMEVQTFEDIRSLSEEGKE